MVCPCVHFPSIFKQMATTGIKKKKRGEKKDREKHHPLSGDEIFGGEG